MSKLIELKFCVGPEGKFMDAQKYKKFIPRSFHFCEILKIAQKIFENPRTIFYYCFIY